LTEFSECFHFEFQMPQIKINVFLEIMNIFILVDFEVFMKTFVNELEYCSEV
jgi:hypothetical protein